MEGLLKLISDEKYEGDPEKIVSTLSRHPPCLRSNHPHPSPQTTIQISIKNEK